ncbi:MAG: hypothetical protein AB7U47_00950, partial [Variibacter sp.]
MTNAALCKMLRKKLARLLRVAFGMDLEQILASRGHELWLVGIDSKNKRFVDICGTIPPVEFAVIESKGFIDTDAGYKTSAQDVLPITTKADVFLLNTDYFSVDDKVAVPLIVHELAHLVEQLGYAPDPHANDDENADAIMASLAANVRSIHTKEWALHLANA